MSAGGASRRVRMRWPSRDGEASQRGVSCRYYGASQVEEHVLWDMEAQARNRRGPWGWATRQFTLASRRGCRHSLALLEERGDGFPHLLAPGTSVRATRTRRPTLIQDVAGRRRGRARSRRVVDEGDGARGPSERIAGVEELDRVGSGRLVGRRDAEAGRVRGVLARERLARWSLGDWIGQARER